MDNDERVRCEACQDAGVIFEKDAEGYSYMRICECRRPFYRERIAGRCGLRFGQLASRFNDYAVAGNKSRRLAFDAIGRIVEWVLNRRSAPRMEEDFVLYLSGANGRGKSYLLEAAVNELAEAAIDYGFDRAFLGRFITEADLVVELQSRLKPAARGEADRGTPDDLINELASFGFLAIDDVGIMPLGEWVQGLIYRLIDRRLQERLPMAFTSNYELADEPDGWLPRSFPAHRRHLLDRLDPVVVEIELTGKSWRREPPAKGGEK